MKDAADPNAYRTTTWWPRAQALQAQGRLDEALALVARACSGDAALQAQAELLAAHVRRALAAGHLSDALRAQERALSGRLH